MPTPFDIENKDHWFLIFDKLKKDTFLIFYLSSKAAQILVKAYIIERIDRLISNKKLNVDTINEQLDWPPAFFLVVLKNKQGLDREIKYTFAQKSPAAAQYFIDTKQANSIEIFNLAKQYSAVASKVLEDSILTEQLSKDNILDLIKEHNLPFDDEIFTNYAKKLELNDLIDAGLRYSSKHAHLIISNPLLAAKLPEKQHSARATSRPNKLAGAIVGAFIGLLTGPTITFLSFAVAGLKTPSSITYTAIAKSKFKTPTKILLRILALPMVIVATPICAAIMTTVGAVLSLPSLFTNSISAARFGWNRGLRDCWKIPKLSMDNSPKNNQLYPFVSSSELIDKKTIKEMANEHKPDLIVTNNSSSASNSSSSSEISNNSNNSSITAVSIVHPSLFTSKVAQTQAKFISNSFLRMRNF